MTDLTTAKMENISPEKLTELLVGKTIKSIQADAVNILGIELTDGTEVVLDVEVALPSLNLYGIMPKVVIHDT